LSHQNPTKSAKKIALWKSKSSQSTDDFDPNGGSTIVTEPSLAQDLDEASVDFSSGEELPLDSK